MGKFRNKIELYNDANLHVMKREHDRLMNIINRRNWDENLETTVEDLQNFIGELLEKIGEMDDNFTEANDDLESLATEIDAFIEFTDAFEISGEHEANEIIAWCNKNLNGKWNFVQNLNHDKNTNRLTYIYMADDQDKVLYRLRWN